MHYKWYSPRLLSQRISTMIGPAISPEWGGKDDRRNEATSLRKRAISDTDRNQCAVCTNMAKQKQQEQKLTKNRALQSTLVYSKW